jgi:PPOX class probable F420-dependent enzyme
VLGDAEYLLLTTFRRSGDAVATPVWVVRDGSMLLLWTQERTGKVKRIRHTPRVLLQPCTFRGRPLGEPVTGTASVLGPAEVPRVQKLIKRKYPFARFYFPLTDVVNVVWRLPLRTAIAVTLD